MPDGVFILRYTAVKAYDLRKLSKNELTIQLADLRTELQTVRRVIRKSLDSCVNKVSPVLYFIARPPGSVSRNAFQAS